MSTPTPHAQSTGSEERLEETEELAPLRLFVTPERAGRRADELLLHELGGFTRNELKRLFEAGRVQSAGRRLKKGDRVEAGAELLVHAPSVAVTPDLSLPLTLLFESPDYVVVDKPAGLPSAPLIRTENRSLAAALLARYPEMQGVGFREREPGLVHRLDTETSGVVLAARSREAFAAARRLLEACALEKRYLALVADGIDAAGVIESSIGPDPSKPGRVRVFSEPPESYHRRAETRYRVLERSGRCCLVELEVKRAFRHQIRAHLAHLGFPILGDQLYEGPAAPELGARHALHASYIGWAGDAERAGFRAEATLPRELRALLGG